MRYDVFICHATEDKQAVANPLARELEARGLKVWIDELQIRLGDSLRSKIDEGLRESKFGVLILSPSFFRKRWTQWELDGLADREMSTGEKVVLPIWHEVDHDDVAAQSPSLANRRAARTAAGIQAVADEIIEVLRTAPRAVPEIERVPRTVEEQAALLRSRPPAWEYLLFAAVLWRKKEALEPKFRDHELRYIRPSGPALDDDEARDLLTGEIGHYTGLSQNVERVLSPAATELAFGEPGQPGDAGRIEHLAWRLIDIYEGFLDSSARLRGARVPERFERAVDLASSFADNPIHDIREFVDRLVAETDPVPALLREERDEPLRIELTLTLTVSDQVVEDFGREMERLGEEDLKRLAEQE